MDLNLLRVSMTGQDILSYLPNCKIIEYNDLADYNEITDLLNKPIDYVIILIETTADNVGHWVCVLRYGNTIESFNSYGEAPDVQKNTLISKSKEEIELFFAPLMLSYVMLLLGFIFYSSHFPECFFTEEKFGPKIAYFVQIYL